MMRAAIAVSAAILAACAAVPERAPPRIETQVVRVPVNVRCVTLAEIPEIPKTRLALTQTAEQKIAALNIDINNLEDYAVKADASLRACAGETQPDKETK